MKIKYEFVNETIEVEVSDEWAAVISDLDRLERNNDKKERRRHYSLDACTYEGMDFAVDDFGIMTFLEENCETEQLRQALDKLSIKQRNLVKAVFFEGMSVNDYAANEGVDHSAISHRLKTIYKKLKKLL